MGRQEADSLCELFMPRVSDETCKAIIRRVAKRLGVEPKLITTRLMSDDDKEDMRQGNLPTEVLELHVKLWMDAGMPDYRHGKTIPLKEENSSVPLKAQRDEPIESNSVDKIAVYL